MRLQLFDLQERSVRVCDKVPIGGQTDFSVSGLPEGVYMRRQEGNRKPLFHRVLIR